MWQTKFHTYAKTTGRITVLHILLVTFFIADGNSEILNKNVASFTLIWSVPNYIVQWYVAL